MTKVVTVFLYPRHTKIAKGVYSFCLLYPQHMKYAKGVYSFCLFCLSVCDIYFVPKISQELLYLEFCNFVHITSMTSCIVGKKKEAVGPGPL